MSVHDESQHPRGRGGKWVAKQGSEPDVDFGVPDTPAAAKMVDPALIPAILSEAVTDDDLPDETIDHLVSHNRDGRPRAFDTLEDVPESVGEWGSKDRAFALHMALGGIEHRLPPRCVLESRREDAWSEHVAVKIRSVEPHGNDVEVSLLNANDVNAESKADYVRRVARRAILDANRGTRAARIADEMRHDAQDEKRAALGWPDGNSLDDSQGWNQTVEKVVFPLGFPMGSPAINGPLTKAQWASRRRTADYYAQGARVDNIDHLRALAVDNLFLFGARSRDRVDALQLAFPRVPRQHVESTLDGWESHPWAKRIGLLNILGRAEAGA